MSGTSLSFGLVATISGCGTTAHVTAGFTGVKGTGPVVPDAGTVAAKVAWIRRHEPDRLSGGQRWIMGPRDLVAFRMTGRADGKLTLEDPATGRRVDLGSFGPTNAAVFAGLMRDPSAGGSPSRTSTEGHP